MNGTLRHTEQLTVNIYPAFIQRWEKRLLRLNEAMLLDLCMMEYNAQHPEESARKAFPAILGCSVQFIDKCIEGRAHMGTQRWLMLERATGIGLYSAWMLLQIRHYTNGGTYDHDCTGQD